MAPSPGYDDYGGGGGGGGESVITLEEFTDLKRAIQTLVEAQASQRRGSRFKIDWKWYHILFLIIFNDMVLIAVGTSIGSAFYGIKPLAGGSFRAGPMEAENIAVNPELGMAQQTIHSVDDEAMLELRAHTSHAAKVTLGDIEAGDNHIYTMQTHTTPGEHPAWMLLEGFEKRMGIESYHNRSDITLSPTMAGKVYVNNDLSLAKSRIGTESSDLVVTPAHGHDLHLAPSINAKVTVHKDMTLQGGAIGTTYSNLELSAARFQNVSIKAMNATVDIHGGAHVTGDSAVQGSLHVRDEISGAHITSYTNADFRGDVLFGDDPTDALDFKGHFRSCIGAHPGIAGTLGAEDGSCEHSTMIFDADDNGAFFAVGVPNTVGPTTHHLVNFEADAMCSKAGRPPNFRRDGEAASWLEQPCMVLTSESSVSMLQEVGDLKKGNIVSGFGTAEVSGLTSRGASNLYGDVTLGISLQNDVAINGHITSNRFVFDRDGDGVRYILTFPDPSTDDFQERLVEFPLETGTVLTSASSYSTLEAVGALSEGSLVTGFGTAEVSELLSTGFSHLSRDVMLGTTSSDEIEVAGHFTSSRMVFDANSDGTTITFEYPDPILVSKTIAFPDESGQVITTASDISTLKAVDELVQGSLGCGQLGSTSSCFGRAQVSELRSDGQSELLGDVKLGLAVTDKLQVHAHITTSTMVFDANSDGVNRLTVFMPDPTQPRTILFPEEDGVLLTTTSTMSRLEEVGELRVGSIVEGFGDATVENLASNGITNINGDLVIGDEITDNVEFNARIGNAELVINHPTADGDLTFEFPRPANDITISFAPLTGEVLTDVSTFSVLTDVGQLSSGEIVDGFGDITLSSDIRTTDLGEITSDGKLTAVSSAQLGTVPEHEITIRGTVEVRGGATTVFSIDPTDGNTFVNGNLEVGGSIEALAAPFYVNAINTGSITELIDDAGVVIEGIVFKDGGFEMARTDQIDEYTEGQGVLVDGVLMRDGGVIAEAALVSTNPRGSIDLVTLINNGRDYEMIGTISKIKFRQYFQATPDSGSFAVDSGAIKVGTETNWNEAHESRSAYMAFDTVYRGDTYERVHISGNGDFAVNEDQLTVTESNADVKMIGNVTIGEGQEGQKRLLINSDDGDVFLDLTAGRSAYGNLVSGPGSASDFTVTSDTSAKFRLVNPSLAIPGSTGIFEIEQLGGAPTQTLQITDGEDPLLTVMLDADGVRGNVLVTGHTQSNSAQIMTLLESEDLTIYGNTTIGDTVNDTLYITSHLTNENITVDHFSDGDNTITLYLPEPSQSRVLEYPDEDGRLLSTTSNYSTLTMVGTLVVGNLGDGFGYADVSMLNVKGDSTLNSDVTLGDSLTQDGVNFDSHIRETHIAYDANSDSNNITFNVPDPTPPIPLFEKRCSTWDGTIVPVTIGFPYDDVRPLDWNNETSVFPVAFEEHQQLIIYNITERRPYSWINCAYNDTIFANKTEVPDSSDYSCADYHAVGYTCNDLVFIFGYDCKATCVTPTLEDDIGIDTGYGWLSLEQALIDHRDMVKELIDEAPSYTISLPEETGTIVLTQCDGDSKTPGKCVTRLPAGGGKCKTAAGFIVAGADTKAICDQDVTNVWTDSFGDIYLGSTEDDSIYIPGIIKGMFTVEGTVLAPATGTARPHPGQSWTVDSMPDRTGLRIDLQEALRFKQTRDEPSTMTITVANQTADRWLALPDETGSLLSSSSTFSTLNSLGILRELEVGGMCTDAAGAVVDVGKDECDSVAANTWTDGDSLFRGDIQLGDTKYEYNAGDIYAADDALVLHAQVASQPNFACQYEDSCTGVATDPQTDTPDIPATCTGTADAPDANGVDDCPTLFAAAADSSAASCDAGCVYTAIVPGTCETAFVATFAAPTVSLGAEDCPAGCAYTPLNVDISGPNPTGDQAACEAFTCTYTAFVQPTCFATDRDACAAQDAVSAADDATCTSGGDCVLCRDAAGAFTCDWDADAIAGLRCQARSFDDCAAEESAFVVPFGDNEAVNQAACEAAALGGCTYTAGTVESCDPKPDSETALRLDGATLGDGNVLNLAVVDPQGSHTLTFPDETGEILSTVSTYSVLEEVGPLKTGSIVGGTCSDPTQTTADGCVNVGGTCTAAATTEAACLGLVGVWTPATWTRGFGDARIESLISDGVTSLNGETMIGDSTDDTLLILSSLKSQSFADPTVLSFKGNTCTDDGDAATAAPAGTTATPCEELFLASATKDALSCPSGCTWTANGPYRLDLDVTGQTADHVITMPGTIGGTILTDETRFGAILEEVGPLKVGSLVGGTCSLLPGAIPGLTQITNLFVSFFVTESDCTGAGGTWEDGFGDARVQDFVATGNSAMMGHIVLGTDEQDYMEIKARIMTNELRFDPSGTYGVDDATVTLDITPPPPNTHSRIYIPASDGTMLLSTSVTSMLQGVGALDTGSIVTGFGTITTDNDVTTVCKASGVCPTFTSGGTTVMEKSTVFSSTGVVAAANIEIPWDSSITRVTSDGTDQTITFSLPTQSDGVIPGQMLVIENDDAVGGTGPAGGEGNNMVHQSGAVRPIWPGAVATYFYIGNMWVQTSWTCAKQSGSYCYNGQDGTQTERVAAGMTNPE
jgi:hypothetical protein